MTSCYLDASALVKLVAAEPESSALRQVVLRHPNRLTSRVATVEVPRALARKGAESVALAGRFALDVFQGVALIDLDVEIATRAAGLEPAALRSLDAIHLASALAMGDELDALITYDIRLADAGRALGLTVVSPA